MEINLNKIQLAGIVGDGVLLVYGNGSWRIQDQAEYEDKDITRAEGTNLDTLAKWMAQ